MGKIQEPGSIVLITIDCLRSNHVGSYGYNRDTTPNIDNLAKSGIRFSKAYSNGPGTRFAFKSINGGVYPLRINGAGLPNREGQTLAETLADQGYRTAAFVNNPYLTGYFNHDRGYQLFLGVDEWTGKPNSAERNLDRLNRFAGKVSSKLDQGPVYRIVNRIYDKLIKAAESKGVQVGTDDHAIVSRAIQWFEAVENPFFAWIHLMGVHHPYRYLPDHREALGIDEATRHIRNPTDIIEPGSQPPDAVIDTYDANIRATDEQVGRIVKALPEDTTVYLTSDHGEEFGKHDHFHTASPYETMSRVPLIISGHGIEPEIVDNLVSHVDIPTTMAEQRGTVQAHWDGTPLDSSTSNRDQVFIGFETLDRVKGGVRRDNWKYICEMADFEDIIDEQLFELDTDPCEGNDCKEDHPKIHQELRAAWLEHIEEIGEDRLEAQRSIWDAEQDLTQTDLSSDNRNETETIERRLEHLGYK